jgi:hypothetical protein
LPILSIFVVAYAFFATECRSSDTGLTAVDAAAVDSADATTGDADLAEGGIDAPRSDGSLSTCVLDSGTCSGRADCCGPFSAFPYDVVRKCYFPVLEPIDCPDEAATSCSAVAEPECYVRTLDDGGQEIFRAGGGMPLPHFAVCPKEMRSEVLAAPACP